MVEYEVLRLCFRNGRRYRPGEILRVEKAYNKCPEGLKRLATKAKDAENNHKKAKQELEDKIQEAEKVQKDAKIEASNSQVIQL